MTDTNNQNQEVEKVETTQMTEKDQEQLLSKWKNRFKISERHKKPYRARDLRMYKLYRSYRDKSNYGYQTSIMPPIGFRVIETVKPRLTAASMNTRLFPLNKRATEKQKVIDDWETLIAYDLQEMDMEEKKTEWVNSMLMFGNGYLELSWNNQKQKTEGKVLDNWLVYVDPMAESRLKNSRYEIKQTFKTLKTIKKEEELRPNGSKLYPYLDTFKDLQDIDNSNHDPRVERYNLETLKMGQIDSSNKPKTSDTDTEETSEEKQKIKNVELWEIYDHEEGKIITIANRKFVIRNEENPYKNINEGRMIVDLPAIKLPWNYYAMSILEPIETLIHEIADGRNQAMDNIVFNLDPIRKIKKGAKINKEDLKVEPGAIWELTNVDDVVTESGTPMDSSWVERDNMLNNEVDGTLALSEYTQGMPISSQEPSSKVEILLSQTNIRLAQFVRQLEQAMSDVSNIIIQLNKEFLQEEKQMRIVGDEISFKDFTEESKNIEIEAKVDIEPKVDKSPEKRKSELLEVYDLFVNQEQVDPNNPEQVAKREKAKIQLKKMILDEMGMSKYADVLMGIETQEQADQNITNKDGMTVDNLNDVMGEIPKQTIPELTQTDPAVLPPQIQTEQQPPGMLQKLLSKFK